MKIKIGSTIKRLRKAQKLTLTELADLTAIHLATLSRMENNKMTGPVESHVAIAKVLGFKLSEYFEECEKDCQPKVSVGKKKAVALASGRPLKPILVGIWDIGSIRGQAGIKALNDLRNKSRILI